jgi:hypothetical protein
MVSPNPGQDGIFETDPFVGNESVWPLTTMSQKTAPSFSDKNPTEEFGTYIGQHFNFVSGKTDSSGSFDNGSGSEMLPTQTCSGSTPISTARDSVSITKQDSSYYNSLPRVKSGLGQPLRSGNSTYKHVFPASVHTRHGDSHHKQLKWVRKDMPPSSSTGTTYLVPRGSNRPATSCDRCRRRKVKCSGRTKQGGSCKECERATVGLNSGGEERCTWKCMDESNQRREWTTTVYKGPSV